MEIEREVLTLIRQVGAIEEALGGLKSRMDAGDRNVRQGVEYLKEVVIDLQSTVKEIGSNILGTEGKQVIRDDILDLKRSVKGLSQSFDEHVNAFEEHQRNHATKEGAEGAMTMFRSRWVIPVATSVITGSIMLLIGYLLGVGG